MIIFEKKKIHVETIFLKSLVFFECQLTEHHKLLFLNIIISMHNSISLLQKFKFLNSFLTT